MLDKERTNAYLGTIVTAIGAILFLFGMLNEQAAMDIDGTAIVAGLTTATLGIGVLIPNVFKLIMYKPN